MNIVQRALHQNAVRRSERASRRLKLSIEQFVFDTSFATNQVRRFGEVCAAALAPKEVQHG